MFNQVLSASFSYVDAIVLAVLAIGLLLGVIRGFSKTFKGFMLSVCIILFSLFLLGVTFEPIRDTVMSVKIEESLNNASGNWGSAFNSPVYSEDGKFVIHTESGSSELKSVDGVKGSIANWLAGKFVTEDGQTVASVVVDNLTSFIVSLIMFILYCIALGILCSILRHITEKMHFSQNSAVKITDRVLGGLTGAGLALMFAFLIFAIFAALENTIPSVTDVIKSSAMGKFLMYDNPIAIVFRNIFG